MRKIYTFDNGRIKSYVVTREDDQAYYANEADGTEIKFPRVQSDWNVPYFADFETCRNWVMQEIQSNLDLLNGPGVNPREREDMVPYYENLIRMHQECKEEP